MTIYSLCAPSVGQKRFPDTSDEQEIIFQKSQKVNRENIHVVYKDLNSAGDGEKNDISRHIRHSPTPPIQRITKMTRKIKIPTRRKKNFEKSVHRKYF